MAGFFPDLLLTSGLIFCYKLYIIPVFEMDMSYESYAEICGKLYLLLGF